MIGSCALPSFFFLPVHPSYRSPFVTTSPTSSLVFLTAGEFRIFTIIDDLMSMGGSSPISIRMIKEKLLDKVDS